MKWNLVNTFDTPEFFSRRFLRFFYGEWNFRPAWYFLALRANRAQFRKFLSVYLGGC
jgi:hypothetical protein